MRRALSRRSSLITFHRCAVSILLCGRRQPRPVLVGDRFDVNDIAADANRWYATVLQDKCVEVTCACWLGLLVNSEAVRKFGLPIAEFFLFDEDLEFTGRLARNGTAYCAIDSVIVHYQDAVFDPFGKDFIKYAHFTRNRVARAKIEPGAIPVRAVRALRRAAHFLSLVARRKAPFRAVPWILRGLFSFWPRIRYPR